jgi:predicted dehydrogenase
MKPQPSRNSSDLSDFNRRDFLKGSSAATLAALAGGAPLVLSVAQGQDAKAAKTQSGQTVKVAVIGCGVWGREILNTLARLPSVEIVALADTYPAMVRRAKTAAPGAETFSDYTKLLENKDIQGVIVATPSHQHKDVVVAALKAGKHVYCEAPLAHTIEDARAIAAAAKAAPLQNFQTGLGLRSDPQRKFLLDFIRAGAAGRTVKARAQSHKKQSWRQTSPNPEREKELNWRLSLETSPGLIGEISIHALDNIAWYLGARPTAVTGFGSTILWDDGREVHDSVEAVFEFPKGALVNCEVTLANSFDAEYEMIYGSDAAVMLRGNKAWMFKEVDAPLLGWEVYARKDTFYKETGIALVANATKLAAQGDKPVEDAPYTNTPLFYALESFAHNTDVIATAMKDFVEQFGDDDKEAMADALKAAIVNNYPAASWRDGFEATVMALKGNEAVVKKARVEIPAALFEV